MADGRAVEGRGRDSEFARKGKWIGGNSAATPMAQSIHARRTGRLGTEGPPKSFGFFAPARPQNCSKTAPKHFSPPLSDSCCECQDLCLPHQPLLVARLLLKVALPPALPAPWPSTQNFVDLLNFRSANGTGSHLLNGTRAPRTTEPRPLHFDSLPPGPALFAPTASSTGPSNIAFSVVHLHVVTAPRSIWPNKMSRFSTGRLLAQSLFQTISKPAVVPSATPLWTRAFSQTPMRKDADSESSSKLMESLTRGIVGMAADPSELTGDKLATNIGLRDTEDEPYHFHIYAHKHNCHITVTKPNRDAIISLSCGNLGFKKSNRKHYDSAYQLGAYVVDKMHQMNLHNKIKKMEVVLRGFGPGREAVIKVLLGNEGRMLRNSIVRVADATRLKFGGTRSKKPRRLG